MRVLLQSTSTLDIERAKHSIRSLNSGDNIVKESADIHPTRFPSKGEIVKPPDDGAAATIAAAPAVSTFGAASRGGTATTKHSTMLGFNAIEQTGSIDATKALEDAETASATAVKKPTGAPLAVSFQSAHEAPPIQPYERARPAAHEDRTFADNRVISKKENIGASPVDRFRRASRKVSLMSTIEDGAKQASIRRRSLGFKTAALNSQRLAFAVKAPDPDQLSFAVLTESLEIFQRFSESHAAAQPRFLIFQGMFKIILGRQMEASRHLKDAVSSARARMMPCEAGIASRELAQLERSREGLDLAGEELARISAVFEANIAHNEALKIAGGESSLHKGRPLINGTQGILSRALRNFGSSDRTSKSTENDLARASRQKARRASAPHLEPKPNLAPRSLHKMASDSGLLLNAHVTASTNQLQRSLSDVCLPEPCHGLDGADDGPAPIVHECASAQEKSAALIWFERFLGSNRQLHPGPRPVSPDTDGLNA